MEFTPNALNWDFSEQQQYLNVDQHMNYFNTFSVDQEKESFFNIPQFQDDHLFHSTQNIQMMTPQSYDNISTALCSDKTQLQEVVNQKEQIGQCDKGDQDIQRRDRRLKNLSQNISSTIFTIAPKLLTGKLKPSKKEVNQIKKYLEEFLVSNQAKNDQLIIVFVSLFFKKINAKDYQFREMKFQLEKYIQKRILQLERIPELQIRQKMLQRLEINLKLLRLYFAKADFQIIPEDLKKHCGPLLTGRQRNTIGKRIKKILQLQQKLNRVNSEQTKLPNQQNIIQSFLQK